uniref:Uncharacterized protein n=1 Tax=Arcella intermedia TaxID=1963864 RepID=A0A6B2KY87_9EUKA
MKVWELLFKNGEVANRLSEIFSEVERKWSMERVLFREEFIRGHKEDGLSEMELTKLLEDETIHLANERLLKAVERDEKLDWFHPLLPGFAVSYFRLFLMVENMSYVRQNEISEKTEEVRSRLKREYPIRSLIPAWLDFYVSKEVSQYFEATEKRKPPVLHQILQKAKEAKIQYFPYFLQKQIDFLDEQTSIENNLRSQQDPSNEYSLYAQIWNPKNWIIETHKSKGEITYSAKKWDEFKVSSSHLGWRWKSLGIRSWCWFKNGFYYTFIVAFLHGPLSLRALFTPSAYYPSKKLNKFTGKLETDTSTKVETFLSRIASVWASVDKSIDDFEKLPDEGILGKNVSRIFNRFWNYVVKGLGGTALLVVFFPAMCAISVVVSFVLSLYAPLWSPILSIIQWLWSILIYDFDYSYHLYPRTLPLFQVFFKFGILGIGQIAACLLLVFLHPQFALLLGALVVTRHSLRYIYDFTLYHVILKRLARVPAVDNFLARRTAGPGLRGDWFFQIETDIALIALQLYLESIEVNEYRARVQKKVMESSQRFTILEKEIFETFGLSFSSEHQSKRDVESRNLEILKLLEDKIDDYKKKIAITSNNNYPRNIKQTAQALAITIETGSKIVEEFYQQNIFYYMSQEEIKEFWAGKKLAEGDWVGLTRQHFNTIFQGSEPFTVPVDENNDFSLKVQHLNLSRFAKMIYDAKPRDDLDLVTANILLKTNNIPKIPQLALQTSPLRGLSFHPYHVDWYQQIKKLKEEQQSGFN